MSPAMAKGLRADAQSHPMRKKALDKLVKDTPLDYQSKVIEVVDVDYNGGGVGTKNFTGDGEMAYQAALLHWAVADPVQADAYGKLALRILRGWSLINRIFHGNNGPLVASWGACSMARAAELLKHSESPAIRDEWTKMEHAWLTWVDTRIMPNLRQPDLWRWSLIGNWHTSILCARMQLAILREDHAEWAWCLAKYPEVLPKAMPCKRCAGELSETTRDVTHSAFLLGGLTQAPEMALHQGHPQLYDARLVDACELQARLLMKEVPEGLGAHEIHTPYGYWYEPVLELPFSHFAGRLGVAMPKTAAYLTTVRPERVTFHWGAATLTHFQRTAK